MVRPVRHCRPHLLNNRPRSPSLDPMPFAQRQNVSPRWAAAFPFDVEVMFAAWAGGVGEVEGGG